MFASLLEVGEHEKDFNICTRHNSLKNLKNVGNYFHKFVVGSRPCSEGFSPGSPVFLPP